MNKTDLDIAYLPLVDSAPFILAEHLGYFSLQPKLAQIMDPS